MATDDEREPRASSDESLSDRDESAPRKPAAKKAAPARKARPAPARDADDDEDDDLDDEDDDLDDEDDDTDDEPPPPRKVSRAPVSKKAAARPAPKKKAVVKVRRVPAKPASSFLPFTFVGMGLVAAHVFWDVAFAPLAVLGIAIVIWSYMGIGSANEPV